MKLRLSKQLWLLYLTLISILAANAQIMMQAPIVPATTDTVIRYLDQAYYYKNPGQPYVNKSKMWTTSGNTWMRQLIDSASGTVIAEGEYDDKNFRYATGLHRNWNTRGQLLDSMYFKNGMRNGPNYSWYENGKLRIQANYTDGRYSGPLAAYDSTGRLTWQLLADGEGNGPSKEFFEDGSLRSQGQYANGRRHGEWLYMEVTQKPVMKVEFIKDSVVQTTCLDSAFLASGKPCIFRREVSYPGGNKGWSNFLSQNLRYPKSAKQADIEGTVKVQFEVDNTGKAENFTILYSPHPDMSAEVMRLMQLTPLWEPAIYLNKPMRTKLAQHITFRLE